MFWKTFLSWAVILIIKNKINYINIFQLRECNYYSKSCFKRPLKNRQNKDLNDKWLLNEGGKYCIMLPFEHSVTLLTCPSFTTFNFCSSCCAEIWTL